MATLCQTFATSTEAQQAVQRLIAAGVPGEHIRVLMGSQPHDASQEREGRFDDHDARQEREGTFADTDPVIHDASQERQGSFADVEPSIHDANAEPQGSFATVDRDTVSTFPRATEHVSVADHGVLLKMLTDAGIDRTAAEQDVQALHNGRVLVLVPTTDANHASVQSLLQQS